MDNLDLLNQDLTLDLTQNLTNYYNTFENFDNPYLNIEINSNYHDIQSFLNIPNVTESPVYLSLNTQSLNSKHANLKLFIEELISKNINIEIIAIQETWNIDYPELVELNGFHPFISKMRRGMRGGGVGFYIKSNISFQILEELSPFEPKIIETITLLVTHPSKNKLIVTSLYKSNGQIANVTENEQNNRFFNHLNNLLEQLSQKQQKTFIFTDSNINLLNLNPTSSASEYMNSLLSSGFIQLICKATRIQNDSRTLLDHIITNNSNNNYTSGVIISDISDHFPIFVLNGKNHKQMEQKHVKSRIFSERNLNNFKTKLNEQTWENVTTNITVDTSYDMFWSTYSKLYEECFPITRIKFNRNIHKNNNFITAGLLNSRRTKLALHKTSILNPTQFNINTYKTYRNLFQKTMRAAKKLYISNKLNENSKNPRETWNILNDVIGRSKKSVKITKINVNGIMSDDPAVISNEFNNFFVKVGKEISDSVPPVTANFENYIPQNPNIEQLNLQNTTPEHIIKIAKSMAGKNSADSDGVSSKMIKFVINSIAFPLSHIFNLSLTTGVFPSKLKKIRVVPIFKSGNVLECDNYRPISMLSSISKILEKIVAKKLLYHLEENNLLYSYQYGFTPGKSTEQNLIQVTNYISQALNENKFCLAVFIDLKKAFDVCSHTILLKKLKHFGINGKAHDWFTSYLSNRTQCVDVNNTLSDEKQLLLSVIQGSILGPILFLIYINDLYCILQAGKVLIILLVIFSMFGS